MARSQSGQLNFSEPKLIRIGSISGTHGLRGALRVRVDNPHSTILQCVERLILDREGDSVEYRVNSVQSAGRETVKLVLDGISDVDQAATLRGAIVMVPVAVLPPRAPREFYYFEAVGCEMVTTTGLTVGIIEEVFSNGANEIWVVRERSAEHLVPVIEDIVKEVDFVARRVVIEAVPGLLD